MDEKEPVKKRTRTSSAPRTSKKAPSAAPAKTTPRVPVEVPSDMSKKTPSAAPAKVTPRVPVEVPADLSTKAPSAAPAKVTPRVPVEVPADLSAKAPSAAPAKVTPRVPVEVPADLSTKAPSAAPAKTTPRAPIDAPPDRCFWVHHGPILKNLRELCDALASGISDEQFGHHVTEERNDFAAWVEVVLQDSECAQGLRRAHTRVGAVRALKKYVETA